MLCYCKAHHAGLVDLYLHAYFGLISVEGIWKQCSIIALLESGEKKSSLFIL